MGHYCVILQVFLIAVNSLAAQEVPERYKQFKSINLSIGYNYSLDEPNDKNFHLIDIGITKSIYGGRHGGGLHFGAGSEIGLTTEEFVIGPKISGAIYYGFLVFGAEAIAYTDFDNVSPRIAPVLGIGSPQVRVTISPHIILGNKEYRPVNDGWINATINLSLKKVER